MFRFLCRASHLEKVMEIRQEGEIDLSSLLKGGNNSNYKYTHMYPSNNIVGGIG